MVKSDKSFYERYWDEKSSDELFDFAYKWPILQKFLPNKKGTIVLDYGCGTGHLLAHMIDAHPKLTYIGADISRSGLKRAKEKIKDIKFILLEEGGQIPLGDNSVDFITCFDVIEHVYETERLLSELFRVLKPGGKLLLSTPYHGVIKNIALSLYGFETVFDPYGPHIRFFTNGTLNNGLRHAGFKIELTGYYGRFYPLSRGFYKLAVK